MANWLALLWAVQRVIGTLSEIQSCDARCGVVTSALFAFLFFLPFFFRWFCSFFSPVSPPLFQGGFFPSCLHSCILSLLLYSALFLAGVTFARWLLGPSFFFFFLFERAFFCCPLGRRSCLHGHPNPSYFFFSFLDVLCPLPSPSGSVRAPPPFFSTAKVVFLISSPYH